MKFLCEKLHMAPDQIRDMDDRDIKDFITIFNYEAEITQDEHRQAQMEAERKSRISA